MQKKVFSSQEEKELIHKIDDDEIFIAKQEFEINEVEVDSEWVEDLPIGANETIKLEKALTPSPRWWKKLLGITALLFSIAVVAQSIQWLIDTWQQHQWIYFAFALVAFFIVILGFTAIFNEWRTLVKLKKHLQWQAQSKEFLQQTFLQVNHKNTENATALCENIAKNLQMQDSTEYQQWQEQLNDAYLPAEITRLFSRTVVKTADEQAKKLISKASAEAAIIVAISPLAVIDMFFIAWRNIRLINKLATIYGIELGYISRLRLLRMVLLNIVFAGATEVLQDIGMDWLSQDMTAKLSVRAAQGIGVGLLTARLGIKAMEFCRPLVFTPEEKPRLSHIQKELLIQLKSAVLKKEKTK
ncbi:TIGR01620 family protein [Seminibacterium arietis]|uniref:UPF0283 membrane protein ACFQ02_00810 n=1 Tax=Seminibacterium arietis TaxID=1173502 RepID=A0ABW3I6G7_9PAST